MRLRKQLGFFQNKTVKWIQLYAWKLLLVEILWPDPFLHRPDSVIGAFSSMACKSSSFSWPENWWSNWPTTFGFRQRPWSHWFKKNQNIPCGCFLKSAFHISAYLAFIFSKLFFFPSRYLGTGGSECLVMQKQGDARGCIAGSTE